MPSGQVLNNSLSFFHWYHQDGLQGQARCHVPTLNLAKLFENCSLFSLSPK